MTIYDHVKGMNEDAFAEFLAWCIWPDYETNKSDRDYRLYYVRAFLDTEYGDPEDS